MAFVIQPAVRPSYRAYSGRADNAAGDRLAADAAVMGLQDTA